MPAHLENSAVATGLEKVIFISIPKKGNAKDCSNYHTIALISHASKVMLKILQARLQQYMNQKIPNKGNTKECSDYHTIALISHASNVMHKILQAKL